ncbi:MAG: transcription elongation factor GreA [Lachnospiraceae bacterium]|nr:transcription elongation factor GreA [Lachnospiraceae bacterium]
MVGEKLTKADVEKIKKEIEERKLVLRPKILEDVKTARAQGDLSENFEYYAARKMNRENNSRIDYLEKMLKYATIIDDDDKGGVSLNNIVKVKFVEDGVDESVWEEESYKIVTSIRADSMKNKISIESPLGKALLTHNAGEIVDVILENGSGYKLKVIDIDKNVNSDDDDLKTF